MPAIRECRGGGGGGGEEEEEARNKERDVQEASDRTDTGGGNCLGFVFAAVWPGPACFVLMTNYVSRESWRTMAKCCSAQTQAGAEAP